jgi:hypothetical protein
MFISGFLAIFLFLEFFHGTPIERGSAHSGGFSGSAVAGFNRSGQQEQPDHRPDKGADKKVARPVGATAKICQRHADGRSDSYADKMSRLHWLPPIMTAIPFHSIILFLSRFICL